MKQTEHRLECTTGRIPLAGLMGACVLSLLMGPPACRAAEAASAAGATYVVAQLHPVSSDTNAGAADRPFRTIARAAEAVRAGDTVLIYDGVYRESVVITNSGTAERPIVFAAAPMANVTVTGADRITAWQRETCDDTNAFVFSTAWPHTFLTWSTRRAHPNDDYHAMIGRAEQVHVNGYPLLQVLSRDKLSRGAFYVDATARRLYVQDRANLDMIRAAADVCVEASVRERIWRCVADHVQVRGLRFRYAANTAQRGAVELLGNHNVMEDCIVERMNGSGADFLNVRPGVRGKGTMIRRCVFRDNGQSGFDMRAVDDLLMSECVCERNNTKDWNRVWGAVNKVVLCRNAVIEKSIFRDNHGNGLWFDIGNEDCVVRNCLIANNDDAGLFYEISYGLHAHDNVIIGNGLAPRHAAWGANGGISISSSPHCLVERNLLIGNKEGFQFREQERTTNRADEAPEAASKQYAVWNYDHVIRNNVIAYNRDFQLGGWFALDGSCWPRALYDKKTGRAPEPPQALPGGPALDRLARRPAGLTLEDLRLNLASNLFALRPGQRFWLWGPTWTDTREIYGTVSEVNAAIGLDAGSCIDSFEFADWATLDLRVPADSPLLKMQCYPRGEVPGVRLGVLKR